MSMKVFLFGLLVCVATQVNSQGPKEFKECKNELNYSGDFRQIGEGATQADKCFVSCMMTKRGELKKDGTIDVTKAKEAIDKCKRCTPEQKEKRYQAAQECATSVTAGANLCENAYKFFMCKKNKKA